LLAFLFPSAQDHFCTIETNPFAGRVCG
jgi:hypothetical protein